MKRREVLIAIAVMIPVAWFVLWLRSWWFLEVLPEQRFGASPEWFSPAHLTHWVFEFTWSFLFGLVVASVVRSRSKVQLAAACGAVAGAIHFALGKDFFTSSAHWTTYVWAYGTYLVPMLGAAIGAKLRVGIVPVKEQRAV